MINIYILWHFGHFFWINISTATYVLWFFIFLFIKKKLKTKKCIEIDIAISTSRILIIVSNLNNMLLPITSYNIMRMFVRVHTDIWDWFPFFWHLCSPGGSLTSGRWADLPQQAVHPHSVRTAPSQPAAAAGAPAGVKRRNHEKAKKTNKLKHGRLFFSTACKALCNFFLFFNKCYINIGINIVH